MGESKEIVVLRARIRAEIGRCGQSIVSRRDWLTLCSNDFVSLGVLAAIEKWHYELVGDATMKFTGAPTL